MKTSPTFASRSALPVWGLLATLMLTACGGGSGGGGSPDPTDPGPGPNPNPNPPTVARGTCTNNSTGATAVNTCFELERIGGLARSFVELSSVALSSTYDRASTVLMANAALPCPVTGTVQASSPRLHEVLLRYEACDFGLGPMTGSVLSRDARDDAARARGDAADRADLTIDIVAGAARAARYQFDGEASDVFDIGVDAGGQGTVTVGTQAPLAVTVTAFASRVAGSTTTQRGTLSSGHGVPGQASATLAPINAQIEFETTPVDSIFVRVSPPRAGSLRYTRSSTPGADGVTTQGDALLEGTGFDLPLRNVVSNGQERIAALWADVIAQPRYEFDQ